MQSEIATALDAKLVADLVNAAYRGVGGRRGWTHEAELISGDRVNPSDVAALIGDGATSVLVRRGTPPTLLGCVAVEMNGANKCTISMVAVEPGRQAAGIGRALLADAERFAADKGATIAKITVVDQREQLIAWYERRGYRRTGDVDAFPYGDHRVGIPLRDGLQLVILEKVL